MHADQGVLTRECTSHDCPVSAKGHQHMSPTLAELIIDRCEPAFIDRLVPGSYPSKLTKPRPPAVRHPTRRFLINIELSEAGLAGQCRYACHECRIVLGDKSLL